jgi:hypothetical protein
MKTQRLLNRLFVSMLSDARNPEYAFIGPRHILAKKSKKMVKFWEEIRLKAECHDTQFCRN